VSEPLIERVEIVALLFNVSDIAHHASNIDEFLRKDDDEEEDDEG
jgi:hypothetical protein